MKREYNRVNALIYEAIVFLSRFFEFFRTNRIVARIKENCFYDWTYFRAEVAIQQVIEQEKRLHAEWAAEEKKEQAPVYSEEEPDGSEAQRLLGGAMRLTARFAKPDPEEK